jgi:hypothetical protein
MANDTTLAAAVIVQWYTPQSSLAKAMSDAKRPGLAQFAESSEHIVPVPVPDSFCVFPEENCKRYRLDAAPPTWYKMV